MGWIDSQTIIGRDSSPIFFLQFTFGLQLLTCTWFGPNLYYSTELLLIICNFWGGWNWYVQKQTGTSNKSIALPHTIVEHSTIKKHFRYQFFYASPFSLPYFTVHLLQPVIVYRQFLSLLEEKKDTHIFFNSYGLDLLKTLKLSQDF